MALQRSKAVEKSNAKNDRYRQIVSDAAATCCLPEYGILPLDNDFPAFGKPYERLADDEWNLIRNITEQRHKALNWICGYAPDNNYDETPTNT